jgi:CDP-glucose 4,6-dehydratase
VLEALRELKKPCVAVFITSDKCYDNVEWVWGYRETDRLGGADPYSASKAGAELAIRSYVQSYFPNDGPVRIGVGRAGNV